MNKMSVKFIRITNHNNFGDCCRDSIGIWKNWLNVFQFQSMFMFAIGINKRRKQFQCPHI